jgi:hypothetical protein
LVYASLTGDMRYFMPAVRANTVAARTGPWFVSTTSLASRISTKAAALARARLALTALLTKPVSQELD